MKLKNNNGFSLAETLVAMVVIFIVSFCAYSTVLMANNAINQNNVINFAINDIKNTSNILDATGGVGAFNLSTFNDNMNWLYDNNVEFSIKNENQYEYLIKKDANNKYDETSNFSLLFVLQTSLDNISLNAQVLKNDKVIFELKNPYIKVLC